ncbi:hypothetical protein PC9H_007404 [Pleurotus ostreatus]|uniref:Uncharacterized protein n=1 Tax=Pleurotus ostreatus TaxID=5322 RepID=A0A8H6ZUU1_PLEOS|nr:uncharacterized protein PC9H_007404 [Pleurotus ostreatus]KAF7428183.1 hypothetical protein PC9H_007404 [Pleurotus ostreatus]
MAISNTYNNSHIGTNNVQSVDNSKHVGAVNNLSDMFNSQCHNSGYTPPSARFVGGHANYSPQNGNSNFFETHRQQAANGMPYGFPFTGMYGSSPGGTPFGSPPNGSWSPQPAPQPAPQPSYSNQGFHAPEPQQASTMPSTEPVPHTQPAAAPPPLARRSVSDPSGDEQSTPSHAQGESQPSPSKKPRFSIHNPFRRSRT